jgi:hypothetical protein
VRLDLDPPRLEADEGKGHRARKHASKLGDDATRLCGGSAPNWRLTERHRRRIYEMT